MNVNAKGTIGELKVYTDLTERGYQIYSPVSDFSPVDAIVLNKNGDVSRIQIKYRKLEINTTIKLKLKTVVNGKSVPVNLNLIDAYVVYCPDIEKVLYIPKKEFINSKSFTIRMEKTNKSKMNKMFSDFLNPEILFNGR